MRILICATSSMPDAIGGSDRVVWQLSRGLAVRGHDVQLVIRRLAPDLPATSIIDGVTIHRYADPWHTFATLYMPSVACAVRALRAAAHDRTPHVVHAHHGISGLAAARAAIGPPMYTFYGPWHQEFLHEVQHRTEMPSLKRWTRRLWAPAKAALARRIERAAVRHARRVVVLSRYSQSQLAEVHAVSGARVSIVPGGVDLQQFVPRLERREARSRLGLAGEGPLLFTVRRLVPRMGLEPLLHALVRLPDARLVIGGSGWLRPRLEASASALGVASRVRFAGRIDDAELPVFYQAADLVVLPSVALEGFGLITLEALACGTPVVATANSGATDVVGPLEPSWIAPDASPAALATTIAGALSASCAPEVNKRCRIHAEQYSWERMVARHEDLYRELVSARV